ncbi:TonB-dependent receptor [Pseudoxanthomonas gei]|uniref:TonB-dependent receptor n=1 Tax=Pseudoxanthomonas gei TaxID=1383030 RepID=A0ABX0AFN5_9GAMM|nr:TonB-dependent receptor [Pseudoxanthomonas gei]NDK39310.1 TonB-dependent receptor [Pseudoxanthomonas gei]
MTLESAFARNWLAIGLALALPPVTAFAVETDSSAPPTDSRHEGDPASGAHIKDLDSVLVTASPLRDAADALSRPAEVLAGERLDETRAASLGETISSLPGVQSSSFGPGVGRPILRGLDGPRVAVLSNGLSTQDVSTVSQDHSPAVESFLADQIEVLKGPSTLLYGSGAIGGIVNVVDGRIPEAPIEGGFSGRAEIRFDSINEGNTDLVRVDAGNDRFALHADAVYRNNKDYDTPNGSQPNTFIDTRTGAVGGSVLGEWGFVGASASRFEDDYGNPGEPGDLSAGERGVWLKIRQDRYDLKGALIEPWGEGSSLRYSFGHTDYNHIEFEGEEVGTTFVKKADEGRVEAAFGGASAWKGAVGLQGGDSTFAAVGEESFVPETRTRSLGIFGVARRNWNDFQLDLGARIDQVEADPLDGPARDFKPVSLSLAGGWRLSEEWRLTANLDHAERAPAEEELFADGPHLATLAYEIGSADLGKEKANQLEFGLQYQSALMDAKVSLYYNRFDDFVYLADTGEQVEFEDGQFLPVRQWSQADARFHGAEGEATFHLANGDRGTWDLRVYGDTVRGALASGGNLPRIAPSRLGTQLRWARESWRGSIGAIRYDKQDKVAVNETPTPGYTLVDAHLAYHHDAGGSAWELFLDGSNLTDQTARVHTSFLKDSVVLPGRGFSTGIRLFF